MTGTRTRRPAACTTCGTRLRGKKDPYVPGTRRHEGRGLCGLCWKRVVKGTRPKPPRPPRCLSCARGWDVVRYEARGLCSGCYGTQRYREVNELVRAPMPAACVRCERPLRGKRDPAKPGAVRFAGRGMCGSCFNANRHGKTVTPRHAPPTECASCHLPMQTRDSARKPGFVVHRARGLCTRCHGAEVRREKKLLAYVLGGAG